MSWRFVLWCGLGAAALFVTIGAGWILSLPASPAGAAAPPVARGETEAMLAAQMEARGAPSGLTYVAFTATPKAKTLELFGRPGPDGLPQPFHVYSMRQAIEEGFILDVLQNYRGLPVPERLTSIRNTIRLSAHDHETAVPRDDPRFVIWGYLKTDDHDEVSPSRTNMTDVS